MNDHIEDYYEFVSNRTCPECGMFTFPETTTMSDLDSKNAVARKLNQVVVGEVAVKTCHICRIVFVATSINNDHFIKSAIAFADRHTRFKRDKDYKFKLLSNGGYKDHA